MQRALAQDRRLTREGTGSVFRSYLWRRKVSLGHFLEILHGLLLPVAVRFKLPRHQLCHPRSGFNASPSAEQQGPGRARKHVLDRSRHLFANSPDHLGADVWQVRMKLFCQRRLFPRNFPNRGRIGAIINPKAWFRDGLPSPTTDLQMLGFAGAFLQAGHGFPLARQDARFPVAGAARYEGVVSTASRRDSTMW